MLEIVLEGADFNDYLQYYFCYGLLKDSFLFLSFLAGPGAGLLGLGG